jgi:hypothetical protein
MSTTSKARGDKRSVGEIKLPAGHIRHQLYQIFSITDTHSFNFDGIPEHHIELEGMCQFLLFLVL